MNDRDDVPTGLTAWWKLSTISVCMITCTLSRIPDALLRSLQFLTLVVSILERDSMILGPASRPVRDGYGPGIP